MIINNKLRKTLSKDKIKFKCTLPQNVQIFTKLIKECLNEGQSCKFQQFFDYFDANCIFSIWNNSAQVQKMKILKSLVFTVSIQNQIICNFEENKPSNQIFILLQGECRYQFQVGKNYLSFPYSCKPGQILRQPYHYQSLNFKPFLLTASTKCVFLKFPYNSILKDALWAQKQNQMQKFTVKLKQYSQQNQDMKQSLNLIPYFSTCYYYRNQIICCSAAKIQTFLYVCEGQIELIKQSNHLVHPIILVTINEGQFFHFSIQKQINQKVFVKCKSTYCKIYSVPFQIIKQINCSNTLASINRQKITSKSLHLKIFSKSQKILKNPLKVFKKQKSRSTNKKRAFSNIEQPWDLIDYFTNSRNRNCRKTNKPIQYANITGRQFYSKKIISNIKKINDQVQKETGSQYNDEIKYPNTFQVKLKSPLGLISNLRTISACPVKQTRNNLLKKTKYKLIRYAKGENFYGLNNYL